MTEAKDTPAVKGSPGIVTKTGDLIDDALDQDKQDDKTLKRMKHPLIKAVVYSMLALLFLIFFTYFLAFILKIPLPESKILEHFLNVILEIMKLMFPSA